MTVRCRPRLVASAGIALLLPACLSFPVQTVELTPPESRDKATAKAQSRKDQFAELPSRPGEVVAIKTAGKDAADGKGTATGPKAPEVTAQKVPEAPGPKAPAPGPDQPDAITVGGQQSPPQTLPPLADAALPEAPLVAVLKAHLDGRTDRAIEILKTLGPANQEFVLAVLPALARGANADLASDPTATALLADQLRAAAARLAPRSALLVENVTLCRQVSGFGRYEPRPEAERYRPNHQGQLYLEVRNLVSQPATGPRGETHLTYVRAAVEIRDAHGKLVEQPDAAEGGRRVPVVRFEEKRYSHGPIEDFHILYTFQVPPAPGVYTITVELRDPAGRRTTKTAPVRFDVAAGP